MILKLQILMEEDMAMVTDMATAMGSMAVDIIPMKRNHF